jgi:hypothetical protein
MQVALRKQVRECSRLDLPMFKRRMEINSALNLSLELLPHVKIKQLSQRIGHKVTTIPRWILSSGIRGKSQ